MKTDAHLAATLAGRKRRWADFYAGRTRCMVLLGITDTNPPARPWPNPG